MSALANKQIRHTINKDIDLSMNETSSTVDSAVPVSLTARIDYVQRFAKQMILVFDDQAEVNSQLARQYLANISQTTNKQEINIAFLAASSKINDIQMRCRIIEQLYANTLFDPEQSLALSILRLAKQSNASVTIVVENAQALSLQIKYELCQLVDIAKKTQVKINVVLFALEQAAKEIALNKTIFDKKVSVIEASSGQVIPLSHARFKVKKTLFTKKTWQIAAVMLLSVIIILLAWGLLAERGKVSLTTKLATPEPNTSIVNVIKKTKTENKKTKAEEIPVKVHEPELASSSDVYSALLPLKQEVSEKDNVADTQDILQALVIAEPQTSTVEQIVSDITPFAEPFTLNEPYYLNSPQGYVVQITAFSDLVILSKFTETYKDFKYYSYYKNLNGQKFTVLTSKIYSDKTHAKLALNSLPQAMSKLGSFIKSVSTIKREINTVNN